MAKGASPDWAESETLTTDEQASMDAGASEAAEETPSATETPAPEGDPAAATETEAGEEQPPRRGMVPHAAFHEERTKRQETERQLAESRREKQTLEERTNIILQRFAQPQQQQQPARAMPEIPAFDVDPAGHILGQVRQQGAILGELVRAVTGQTQHQRASSEDQQLADQAADMEHEYAASHPDYNKAAQFLFEKRKEELREEGWKHPREIFQQMKFEAKNLTMAAIRQGRNPAEVVEALAKLRGYAAAPEPAPVNGAAGGEDQLHRIAAGQQQSRTTGNLRGGAASPLNATTLLAMSEEEFAAKYKTNKKEMDEIMGH